MTMDDFAPKLQPIEVILQMPEQTLSLANFGPYAIAITSFIAAIAAIIAICNTNKQNNKNRLHDKELKHHEFIMDKFEEMNSLILELEKWQLEFFNYAPGLKERFVLLPFPEALAKATLIAHLYFPSLEKDISNLGITCDTAKSIYFHVTSIIMSIKKHDKNFRRYEGLVNKFKTIHNIPIYKLFESLSPEDINELFESKLTKEEIAVLDNTYQFLEIDERNQNQLEKRYIQIAYLYQLISSESETLIKQISDLAKTYSSNFTTTMEKEALKDKAWRKAIISFFKRKRKKP